MTRVMKRQLEEELDLEKANTIKPAAMQVMPESPAAKSPAVDQESVHRPANEDDDTFSPAHDADSVGTGVGDDEEFEAEEADSVDLADDQPAVDDEKETRP